jgi:hypothetical protein
VVPPDSDRITRAPSYSGYRSLTQIFVYGAITRYGYTFQSILLIVVNAKCGPTTPDASIWFGLIPVRSPLLGESQLIYIPLGTEMFHFPRFAPRRVLTISNKWVSPFGNLRIKAFWRLPEAYRSLTRPSSPLLAKASTVCP